jgi:hypothetical protein
MAAKLRTTKLVICRFPGADRLPEFQWFSRSWNPPLYSELAQPLFAFACGPKPESLNDASNSQRGAEVIADLSEP